MADGTVVQVDVRGVQALRRRVAAGLGGEIAAAVAARVARTARESLGTGTAGRSYPRGGRVHVASAAGQPPAVDSGALRESIRGERTGVDSAHVTDGVPYGVYLEFGTRRAAPRPFMLPAVEAVREDVAALARDVLEGGAA